MNLLDFIIGVIVGFVLTSVSFIILIVREKRK